MIIDFANMEEKDFPAFKGGTGVFTAKMFFDGETRIMKGYLHPGSSIGMHKHEGTSETVCILSGKGKMICDGEEELLEAGCVSFCPEGHTHSLINTGEEPLYFIGVVPTVK